MTIQVLSTGHRMFTCGNEHGDRFIYRFWSESAEDMRIDNEWNTADALAPIEGMKRSAEADAFAIGFARREGWINS